MGISSNNKRPNVTGKSENKVSCNVPEVSVFFNFQYITSDSRYNLIDNNVDKKIFKALITALHKISQCSWKDLQTKGKSSGGYEMLEYGIMKSSIANNLKDKPLTNDTKLYVFRFGGNNYRMIGYKSNSCKAALHILGFDIDHSLYDHA